MVKFSESKIDGKSTMTWILVIGLSIIVLFSGVFYLRNRTNRTVISSGLTRRYLLYVPDSYQPDRPVPLVISVHGFVQWPAHQARLTGWNQLADREGFLMAYPKGRGFPLRWYTQPIAADQEKSGEDVQFFKDLISQLSASYNIDPDRIYVNGMSNGGGMTNLLASELSERIAAFGGVAGAYLPPAEIPKDHRPVPWIAFHGVNDPIVSYLGEEINRGQRVSRFPPIEVWAADWARANGCRLQPESEKVADQVTKISYQNCRGAGDVILYKIEGAGHTWPGGGWLPRWLTGKTYHGISATQLMWEFFQSHPLPE